MTSLLAKEQVELKILKRKQLGFVMIKKNGKKFRAGGSDAQWRSKAPMSKKR
ncbi:MAG: hypothetical protein HRT89_05775 [Lentisphaeria bacterium]|nr:hypothetical protein [Lentisphaeria bacterium]NQZ67561.1 hypothetical protein [Lentisphaeria bacterium]